MHFFHSKKKVICLKLFDLCNLEQYKYNFELVSTSQNYKTFFNCFNRMKKKIVKAEKYRKYR